MNIIKNIILYTIYILFFPFFLFVVLLRRVLVKRKKPNLLWGPMPILNNKYWSEAVKTKGYFSKTLMYTFYSKINKKVDYDLYINQFGIGPNWLKNIDPIIRVLISFTYSIFKFDIFHIPCSGHILGFTPLKAIEPFLLKIAGIKMVVLPYGGDQYQYSKIKDYNLTIALLKSYPQAAKKSKSIERDVLRWEKNGDCIIPGIQIDGFNRFDIIANSYLSLNLVNWQSKNKYNKSNSVKVAHSPNHRGFKGTEFIIKAVEDLKEEGLDVELILIEGKQNDEVKRILYEEADILVEQLIFTGYALSGLEGMATGLPVIAQLDNDDYTSVFKRFSYLKECPIHSANVDNIKDRLRELVMNPELREELGRKGRKYVEKYHSYFASAYFFDQIYQKIWYGKDIDLMNMYHPLNPDSYNNIYEKIKPKDV